MITAQYVYHSFALVFAKLRSIQLLNFKQLRDDYRVTLIIYEVSDSLLYTNNYAFENFNIAQYDAFLKK